MGPEQQDHICGPKVLPQTGDLEISTRDVMPGGIHPKVMVLPWMQVGGFRSNNVWKYVKYCNMHRVLVLYALYIQGIMHSTNIPCTSDPVFHPNGWNGVDHDPRIHLRIHDPRPSGHQRCVAPRLSDGVTISMSDWA